LIVESLLSMHLKGIHISAKVVSKLRNKLNELSNWNKKKEIESLLQSLRLVATKENEDHDNQDWLLQALLGKQIAMHVKFDIGSIHAWAEFNYCFYSLKIRY